MKGIIQPLKGTRDYYPEIMAMRNWLYSTIRQVSESFGYQEYEAPFLESIDLYAAKSGEELVNKQSYVFPDRGGDMITLRPELTPSLARMVAQRQRELTFPLRWWSFGPFWRYERPQKGRTREFFQWNIDMIGVNTPEADAELITILATFFKTLGLKSSEINIQVNDRHLLEMELEKIGFASDAVREISRWIDRRDKLSPTDWEEYGRDLGVSNGQLEAVKALLKNDGLWKNSNELVQTFKALEAMGMMEYVQYNPAVIRGLDYYTGIVFEAFDLSGDVPRAIMGGGRYNNLLADVGGEAVAATGFAMGDVVITLILESKGLIPKNLGGSPAEVLVTVFDEERLNVSYEFAAELREAGIKAACYPEVAKLPRQFKYADRMQISTVAVIGPDEAAKGQVTVKDLASGEQQTVLRKEAVNILKKKKR
ncbi:MAG TPA: histidine--tRNA ligase [Anaerolineales bacterium]|nr:histidine--tRNA ligase [Anaerolineales bacterium]